MYIITKTNCCTLLTDILSSHQNKKDSLLWISNYFQDDKNKKLNIEQTIKKDIIYEYQRQPGFLFNAKNLINIYQIHDHNNKIICSPKK
jgi:hypothetical protein